MCVCEREREGERERERERGMSEGGREEEREGAKKQRKRGRLSVFECVYSYAYIHALMFGNTYVETLRHIYTRQTCTSVY